MPRDNYSICLKLFCKKAFETFASLKQSCRRSIDVKLFTSGHIGMFAFFISTAALILFLERGKEGFKTLFLLPVIFYSIRFGTRWGYIISVISSAIIFYRFLTLSPPGGKILIPEADFILIGMFFLLSWFLGNIISLERGIKKQLSETIIKDPLTGLYNYRYLQQQLEKMIQCSSNSHGKIALIMIDLDNFKTYNEIMGHSSGDMLLQNVAGTIKNCLEEKEFAVRYGGDEFTVVIPCLETLQAINRAEKIRKAINAIQGEKPENNWTLSASLGIAFYPDHAEDKQGLLQKADEALYKAKIKKGNCVQLYYSIFDRLSGQLLDKEKDFLNTLKTLMYIINARDKFTFNHSERVLAYTQAICRELRLPTKETALIEYAAFLHDIGKIEISRELLSQKEKLTALDRKTLEHHPLWGAEILRPIKKMEEVLPIIIHHHERFDGKGYPMGLKGEEIPLGARIIAVANEFDLFTAGLPYQEGRAIREGIEYLKQKKGTLFDPRIVDAFIARLRHFQNLYQIIEWPRYLLRLVPMGYLSGCFMLGGHYFDFYSGDFHFIIKNTAYLAAAVVNNEKGFYFLEETKEKKLLEELKRYSYNGVQINNVLKKNQLRRMTLPEDLLNSLHRKAKLAMETRNFFKQLRDEAFEEGFITLRVILDGSSLPFSKEELILWEKNLSRCTKDLEIVVICLYNIDKEGIEMCRLLTDLHDKPLLKEEGKNDQIKKR